MAALLVNQFVVYGLAWAVGALLLRQLRAPLLLWCGYCLLQAGGLQLQIGSASQQPGLSPVASVLMLLAYAAAALGMDTFLNGRARHAAWWLALAGVASAWQLAALWWPLPLLWRAIGHNLGVVALLLVPMLALQGTLRREFGRWGLLPIVPGALVCFFALLRVWVIARNPDQLLSAPLTLTHNAPLLTVTLYAAGAFNIAFIGLVVGRLVRQLSRRLDTDLLTGLANRGALERHLQQAWAASRRHGQALAVAFIDIDRFKQINDLAGHEAGDRVIQGVALALQTSARATDWVGRWGGDEFMVVMPNTDAPAAQQAMQRLRERVQETGPALPAGCAPLGLSIGIATLEPNDVQVNDLVMRADARMYRAKRGQCDPPSAAPSSTPLSAAP